MVLNLDALVEDLERKRDEFSRMIVELHRGNWHYLASLDPKLFNPTDKELILLTLPIFSPSEPRKSGRQYYSHQLSAVYLADKFLDKEHPNFDKTKRIILVHDLVDEAWKYDEGRANGERESFGLRFKEDLDSAILMAPPQSRDFPTIQGWYVNFQFEKVAQIVQVLTYGGEAEANALCADTLDNQTDNSYLTGLNADGARYKLKVSTAKLIFIASELSQRAPEMTKVMLEVSQAMIAEYGIDQEGINSSLRCYNDIKNLYKHEAQSRIKGPFIQGIESHLKKFRFQIPQDFSYR